jgi:hypothetical protein
MIEVGMRVRMAHRYGTAIVRRIVPPAWENDQAAPGPWRAQIELPHRTPAYRLEWVSLGQLEPAEPQG